MADPQGNVYFSDDNNNRVWKLDVTTGLLWTYAGNGTGALGGDNGPATLASMDGPRGVALDAQNNLYIVSPYDNDVRFVNQATGIITTVAGVAGAGSGVSSGDNGPATLAGLNFPTGICLDASGNLYIAEQGADVIRKITIATGIITTIAGTNGTASFGGDNGPALSAFLNTPNSVSVDASNRLLISDLGNDRIRVVDLSTNTISTIAGNGTNSFSGDGGPATLATLDQPYCVSATGSVFYIADSLNNRIRRVDESTGIITTYAGNGAQGFSGDGGPATLASLNGPLGVFMNGQGVLYLTDSSNHRVREVHPGPPPTPTPAPLYPDQLYLARNLVRLGLGETLLIGFLSDSPNSNKLLVYNSAGEKIRSLYWGNAAIGVMNPVTWDGRNDQGGQAASGVYIVVFSRPGLLLKAKVLVVR